MLPSHTVPAMFSSHAPSHAFKPRILSVAAVEPEAHVTMKFLSAIGSGQ
jgi:hypothetical protein